LSIVPYIILYLTLGSVVSIELVLDLDLGSLSILFIVGSVYFFSTKAIIIAKIVYLGFLASRTNGAAPII